MAHWIETSYASRAGLAAGLLIFLPLGGARAGPQDPLLGERHAVTPEVSLDARDLALADVDGDGHLDLVLALAGRERLWRGDAEGLLVAAPGAFPTPSGWGSMSKAVALFDADGDGDLDVLVGNGEFWSSTSGAFPNELFLNDGSGTFSDASAQLSTPHDVTSSLAVGDLDLDGDLDVLVGNSGDEDSYCEPDVLLWNDGGGAFSGAPLVAPPECTQTWAVALLDVDADGDLDAWTGDVGAGRLYLNDGSGGFTPAPGQLPPVTASGVRAVAWGDVDLDGDLDLVVGCTGSDLLLLNDGGGTFRDGSGLLPADARPTEAVELLDLDADGDLDLFVGKPNGGNRLVENVGGAFVDVSASGLSDELDGSVAARAADLDGDGDVDLVSAGFFERRVRRLWNDGAGALHLAPRPLPFQRGSTYAALLVDVDGDRWLDAVLGDHLAPNRLLLGTGEGFFAPAPSELPWADDHWMALAAGDVDGDGDVDLMCGNGSPITPELAQNRLLLGDGAGAFVDASVKLPQGLDNTWALALGDVDGDGDLDVVVGNYGQDDRLDLNDGAGGFVTSGGVPAGTLWTRDVELGDVDGDGALDLVVATFSSERLLLNDGAGVFTDVSATHLPPPTGDGRDLALGDVDLDGDLDLAIACGNPVPERLLLNDGAGVFSEASGQLPGASTFNASVALADLDGDGDLDLLLGSWGEDFLYLNDGGGWYSDASERLDRDDSSSLALGLGDVDLDGDLDLLVAGQGAERLLCGRTRQLAWRAPARVGRDLVLEVDGPPGGSALVLASLGEALVPHAGIGVLLIDRSRVFASLPVALDADGFGSATLPVPPDPALVGVTWSWQALVVPPRRLTNLERTTITPW